MSEYQYYEFQAIDRPLDEADRRALRAISTRARITATSFTNTYEWGDYLLWAGPKNAKWFVNSHAHLAPREVWEDYLRIVGLSRDWEARLDRYGVNTIVLERNMSADLVRALKEKPEAWSLEFQDQFTAVFVRKKPV